MFDRISIDPKICHGQACIKGTRMPVHQIIGMLANGDTLESLLKAYPHISREDILACLEYAAWLAEEQITPIEEVAAISITLLLQRVPVFGFVSCMMERKQKNFYLQ